MNVHFQIVTTFELPGCEDMWTVMQPPANNEEQARSDIDGVHGFLILSHEDSSMVQFVTILFIQNL